MSENDSQEGLDEDYPEQMAPQHLFDQGHYQKASEVLLKRISQNPTDTDRRLLARSLVLSSDGDVPPEALRYAEEIEGKSVHDIRLIGWLCLELEQWDAAIDALEQAVSLDDAFTHYWLALAYRRGRRMYELDEQSKASIECHLWAAVDLDDCPVEAFLWLEELQDWSEEGVDARVDLLRAALEQYPEADEVRFRLAERLTYRLSEPREALSVIAPLSSQDEPELRVLWLTFILHRDTGEYSTALDRLDEIRSRVEVEELHLLAVRSVILQEMGNYEHSLIGFDQILSADVQEFGLLVISIMGQVAAYIAADRIEESAHCMDSLTELCWQQARREWGIDTFGAYDFPLWFDGHVTGYNSNSYVLETCQYIIDRGSIFLSEESQGWLLYIQACIRYFSFEQVDNSLLIAASRLLDHPVASSLLMDYFLNAVRDAVSAVEHHLRYALWKHAVRDPEEEFRQWMGEFNCYDEEGNPVEIGDAGTRNRIHQIAMRYLRDCQDTNAVHEVFEPFYQSFWRSVLVDGQMFSEFTDANALFLKMLDGSDTHLWDHALGLQRIGRAKEAEVEYREYLGRHPDNASTMHNLSIILEEAGLVEEAFELSKRATALNPDDVLCAQWYQTLKAKRDQKHKIQDMIENSHLGAEKQRELDEFYWQTDVSTADLEKYYGLPKAVHNFVTPAVTDVVCPNCGWYLVYQTRSAKSHSDRSCQNCSHVEKRNCKCEHCTKVREKQERLRKEKRLRDERAAYEKRVEEVSSKKYVDWALAQLTRREKIFMRSFLEVVAESDSPTWEEIANRAKVVSHKKYSEKLMHLGLLLHPPNGGIVSNPGLSVDMIDLPERVRSISKSTRFEILQRDNHTCQYCGRKAPDVELQIDHLVPVARGGTDDFENLVTSCADCNSGKSAKLIEEFTGGHTIEEWRETLRERRMEALRERRAQLPEVIDYWAECRGARTVSAHDEEFIYNLIEIYEPAWIKEAIRIATGKRVSNYAKYAAAILHNWAKDGPPEYIRDPDGYLERKKATPKQIDYIAGLLKPLGLELGDFYHKSDFEELTMLDARNLIDALKKPVGKSSDDECDTESEESGA